MHRTVFTHFDGLCRRLGAGGTVLELVPGRRRIPPGAAVARERHPAHGIDMRPAGGTARHRDAGRNCNHMPMIESCSIDLVLCNSCWSATVPCLADARRNAAGAEARGAIHGGCARLCGAPACPLLRALGLLWKRPLPGAAALQILACLRHRPCRASLSGRLFPLRARCHARGLARWAGHGLGRGDHAAAALHRGWAEASIHWLTAAQGGRGTSPSISSARNTVAAVGQDVRRADRPGSRRSRRRPPLTRQIGGRSPSMRREWRGVVEGGDEVERCRSAREPACGDRGGGSGGRAPGGDAPSASVLTATRSDQVAAGAGLFRIRCTCPASGQSKQPLVKPTRRPAAFRRATCARSGFYRPLRPRLMSFCQIGLESRRRRARTPGRRGALHGLRAAATASSLPIQRRRRRPAWR